MAEHQPHHADVSHETSDVNIRPILATGAGLLVLGMVVYFVVWLLFAFGVLNNSGDIHVPRIQ